MVCASYTVLLISHIKNIHDIFIERAFFYKIRRHLIYEKRSLKGELFLYELCLDTIDTLCLLHDVCFDHLLPSK